MRISDWSSDVCSSDLGTPPIRAKKARYFEDRRFQERVLPPPRLAKPAEGKPDDWSALPLPSRPQLDAAAQQDGTGDDDTTGSERRQQPELTAVKPVEKKAPIEDRKSTRLNSSH